MYYLDDDPIVSIKDVKQEGSPLGKFVAPQGHQTWYCIVGVTPTGVTALPVAIGGTILDYTEFQTHPLSDGTLVYVGDTAGWKKAQPKLWRNIQEWFPALKEL